MLDFGEKRKYKRVDMNIPLQYRQLHGDKKITGTLTRNLSEGGVKFKTDQFVSLACRMIIEVVLPEEIKPIKAIAKVAWIKKLPAGDNYEIGNQFLDITREDKHLISSYIKRTAEKELESPEF